MLSTPLDLSTPKRRKLYHRDPSHPIPKQTLWYTANKARKETMNADNGSDNEDEYPSDSNGARSNYCRDEDPSDLDGGGGGDGGDEYPSDSDGGGGGDGGDARPQ